MCYLLTETIAAVDGAITAGLERNLARLAALGANGIEHLTAAAAISATNIALASITAALATLRLIGKALLCKKLLFAGSESELLAAIFTSDLFVLEHVVTSFKLVRLTAIPYHTFVLVKSQENYLKLEEYCCTRCCKKYR